MGMVTLGEGSWDKLSAQCRLGDAFPYWTNIGDKNAGNLNHNAGEHETPNSSIGVE
jgi:hypothetical protein